MRKPVREFVRICAENLPVSGPVFEFGALQVHADEVLEDLRPLFARLDYVGCDMRPGPGVDRVLNLHDIDVADNSVGCVVCMDTLEHVEYPRRAVAEIRRILVPGGLVILSSVMNFPIHGYPNDYWRFTPAGFASLLQDFSDTVVACYGDRDDFPQTIAGVGFKSGERDMAPFQRAREQWEHWYNSVARKEAARV
jgi:SAM-dependent methyltransferase